MNLFKSIATIAVLALATLMVTVPAKAQFLPVYGNSVFIKGANLPWLDGAYSNYLAVDPHHTDYGVAYNSSSMNAHLADMHNMGINVVRLWIFQDDQGCTLDGSGNVTGVTSQFWTNLDDTVRLAGNNNIALYVCLNNGRADFLQNSTLLNSFINNALKPLIQRYKGNQRIFAIDAMNEIDGVVAGNDGNYSSNGASWPQAQSYMRTIVSAVHSVDSTRLVSCSSGWHSYNNLTKYFKGQTLDFYDFHQYDDNGYMPAASTFGLDKPIYEGEAGQSSSNYSDSAQNSAETGFLNNAKNGYAGVGIWSYDYAANTNSVFKMLNTNGSWRPVCYTIQNFHYSGSGGGGSQTIANGTYKIANRNNGGGSSWLVLDVYGSSTANGATIDQYAYNGGNNQKWNVTYLGSGQYSIVNVNANKPLDVTNSGGSGAWTELWDSNNGANQKWVITATDSGWYRVSPSYNTGLALDVYGAVTTQYPGSGSNGRIDVYNWSGNYNQQWAFWTP